MSFYSKILRPLLFRLSPERADALAHLALRWAPPWRLLGAGARVDDPRLAVEVGGLKLRSPIGLAPGFDKNAELIGGLSQLGFGYVVVGSITTEPRAGNPKPRMVRYPARLSLANSMGLPNNGLVAALARLRSQRGDCPVIVSVAGFSAAELVAATRAVEPYVDAVEIGLVCPNSTETERLEERRSFVSMVDGLASGKRKPMFIKVPPHHNEADRARVFAMLDDCIAAGLEGIAVNGSRQVVEPSLATGRGSIAGRETYQDALRIARDLAEHAAGRLALRVSGGVFTGEHARTMFEAGADAVELYSAFVYRGWDVAGRINRELLALLEREGRGSVRELRPAAQAQSAAGLT
jgi:dihydroorotate dehydrogenase